MALMATLRHACGHVSATAQSVWAVLSETTPPPPDYLGGLQNMAMVPAIRHLSLVPLHLLCSRLLK